MTNYPLGLGTKLQKQDFFEDPTLPLQVYIRDPQPEFPMHSHGFDELVIILKGTAIHVIDQLEFPVKAGDVFVIAQNHEHQYQEMHGLALANILFEPEALMMNQWDYDRVRDSALFSLPECDTFLFSSDVSDEGAAALRKLTFGRHASSKRPLSLDIFRFERGHIVGHRQRAGVGDHDGADRGRVGDTSERIDRANG